MSNQQTNINVDKILRVKLIPRQQCTIYTWTEAEPEKKFLWWVSQEATPAGWKRSGYLDILNEEDILQDKERIFKRYDVCKFPSYKSSVLKIRDLVIRNNLLIFVK